MSDEDSDDLMVQHQDNNFSLNIPQALNDSDTLGNTDTNTENRLPEILINPETGQEVSFFDFPRNSLCPCGSNKKFKHCHGTPNEFARLMAS